MVPWWRAGAGGVLAGERQSPDRPLELLHVIPRAVVPGRVGLHANASGSSPHDFIDHRRAGGGQVGVQCKESFEPRAGVSGII